MEPIEKMFKIKKNKVRYHKYDYMTCLWDSEIASQNFQ